MTTQEAEDRRVGWYSLALNAWRTAEATGWHHYDEENPKRTPSDAVALFHSEITEAFNEWRDGHEIDHIYFDEEKDDKPEGFLVELADEVIRIAEYVEEEGLTNMFCYVMELKLAYNTTRPRRHGGKRV